LHSPSTKEKERKNAKSKSFCCLVRHYFGRIFYHSKVCDERKLFRFVLFFNAKDDTDSQVLHRAIAIIY
jgi:hypothetical protein